MFKALHHQLTREVWDNTNGQNEKSDDKHAGDPSYLATMPLYALNVYPVPTVMCREILLQV